MKTYTLETLEEKAANCHLPLGDGCYKEAWSVIGQPDRAIITTNYPSDFIRELDTIRDLECRGFPVIQIHDVFFKKMSNKRLMCAIADRYYDGVRGKGRTNIHLILNEKTSSDVQKIRNLINVNKIFIQDLQFLFKEDGSVVINDPQDVYADKYKWNDHQEENARTLDRIEAGVRLAKLVKANDPSVDTLVETYCTRSFFDEAIDRFGSVLKRDRNENSGYHVHADLIIAA